MKLLRLGCGCGILGTVLSALLAVAISNGSKIGLWRYLDEKADSSGRQFLKGMFPALHEGTPWGFTIEAMPDLTGQVFLVTGANVGLGYWTAHHLAVAKGTVVIACRSKDKCEMAAGEIRTAAGSEAVHAMTLDLSSFESIRAFTREYTARGFSLDGLILNAGIMIPPFERTSEGLESQIGVNHFGHFLLTKLLQPQLEAAVSQRGVATVVAVSSAAHFDSYAEGILPLERMNSESGYDRAKAYGQSKLANVLFIQEYADRMGQLGILANAVHPGGVDTSLTRHLEVFVASIFGSAVQNYLTKTLLPSFAWHPRDASLTALYAAVSPAVRQGKVSGKYFHPIARETRPDPHAFNSTLQTMLWAMSENFVATH